MTAANPLVEEVLSGRSYELRVLAAQGILPLSLSDLVPLQVLLARDQDAFLAESARSSLAALNVRIAAVYLASEAPASVQRYFSAPEADSRLREALLRRRDVARDLLAEMAPELSPDLQEVLLLRQDAIVEHPGILDRLEANAELSPFARQRILEYRQHLLPRVLQPAAISVDDRSAEDSELTEDELAEIERAKHLPAGGDSDRTTGLSEQQIRALPVPLRLKLARGASRTLRSILIRDINANVALSVLGNAAFTEDEIEQVAGSRSVVDDVLIAISRRREWISRRGICLHLARNPRTPAGIAVRLVSRLSVRELRNLSRDRNVSDAVRRAALRLYKIKAV